MNQQQDGLACKSGKRKKYKPVSGRADKVWKNAFRQMTQHHLYTGLGLIWPRFHWMPHNFGFEVILLCRAMKLRRGQLFWKMNLQER